MSLSIVKTPLMIQSFLDSNPRVHSFPLEFPQYIIDLSSDSFTNLTSNYRNSMMNFIDCLKTATINAEAHLAQYNSQSIFKSDFNDKIHSSYFHELSEDQSKFTELYQSIQNTLSTTLSSNFLKSQNTMDELSTLMDKAIKN